MKHQKRWGIMILAIAILWFVAAARLLTLETNWVRIMAPVNR